MLMLFRAAAFPPSAIAAGRFSTTSRIPVSAHSFASAEFASAPTFRKPSIRCASASQPVARVTAGGIECVNAGIESASAGTMNLSEISFFTPSRRSTMFA